MVPDTVMLNAHKTSSSSMDKPMSMDGTHLQVIQMPVKVNGDLAALKWIFGKLTTSQVPSLLIHVTMMDYGDAKTKLIAETPIGTVEFVIKMVAILTHIELVSQISSDLDQTSSLTPLSQ
jgi:hypothetical protein